MFLSCWWLPKYMSFLRIVLSCSVMFYRRIALIAFTECLCQISSRWIMRSFEQPMAWAIAGATWLRLCSWKLRLIICAQVGTGHSDMHEDQHGHLVLEDGWKISSSKSNKMQEVLEAESWNQGSARGLGLQGLVVFFVFVALDCIVTWDCLTGFQHHMWALNWFRTLALNVCVTSKC